MTKPDDKSIALSRELQGVARGIDLLLERLAGGRCNFSLVVWSDAPGQRAQYVSNCQRDDVVKAMQELLDRWQAGMPDVPAHEVQ